jgi:hypothetical protein
MLSWDEFDKEDLQGEFSTYAEAAREHAATHRGFLTATHSDSAAVARAKAALDKLDLIMACELQAVRSASIDAWSFYGESIRAVRGLESGSHNFYDIHLEYSKFSAIRDVVGRIVAIFAACILSARTCSLATVSRNATLRTPLFAYDAELSIVRHRLRAAL